MFRAVCYFFIIRSCVVLEKGYMQKRLIFALFIILITSFSHIIILCSNSIFEFSPLYFPLSHSRNYGISQYVVSAPIEILVSCAHVFLLRFSEDLHMPGRFVLLWDGTAIGE